MKKLLVLIPLLLVLISKGQELLPFATGNFAGVSGAHLQPASIADSRFKTDLTIFSTSTSFSNTFYKVDPYLVWNPKEINNEDLFDLYLSSTIDGKAKHGYFSTKNDFFSFMLTLSRKDAIAFTPSFRTMFNFDNITEDLATFLDGGLEDSQYWNKSLTNANFSLQMNSWVEYAITYARVISDKEKHFLKAGATIKFTQGLGSAYLFAKDLSYNFRNNDTLSLFKSYVSYGTSDNLENDLNYKFNTNPSLAFDFGVVYEFRPDWMKYKYDLDGETNLWRRDRDKYLFKIGLSLTDLGSVKYRRNPLSRDFDANITDMNIGDLEISGLEDFNNIIDSNFNYYDVPEKYNMNLPAVLSMQADVRISRGLYLNFVPYFAMKQGNKDDSKTHYVSSLNLIPRFDMRLLGFSLPIQYNAYNQLNVGLGLRVGPIWVGSNNLFSSMLSGKDLYGTSVSAALKLPLCFHAPKDKDLDKISDRKDDCPDLAGIPAMNGCPDADGDGITDENDKCPSVAGLKELNGCPDKDSDGITDLEDACPEVRGLAAYQGCPDSDGDGIIDQNDLCPYNAGIATLGGCPDQDSDGIPDNDDNCPTVAGTRENKGCPFIDSDGDGIKDESDACPTVAGPIENGGCPYQDTDNDGIPDKNDECPSIAGELIFNGCPDTDGDGISDKFDMCPTIKGVPENKGCPEIKKEEQDVLKKAFDNLEFETGKAIIRSTSLPSLDELASVMKKRPEFKLYLAGHTDNVGNPAANLTLSKNRTLAVKNHFVKLGIDASRIKTEWFGQTKPVASNSTAEGKQKNRRVEMNIIFE